MKKILGFICISLIIPIILLLFQLVYKEDMPGLSSFNLYLQAIIAGFVLDIFFGVIIFLAVIGASLIDN